MFSRTGQTLQSRSWSALVDGVQTRCHEEARAARGQKVAEQDEGRSGGEEGRDKIWQFRTAEADIPWEGRQSISDKKAPRDLLFYISYLASSSRWEVPVQMGWGKECRLSGCEK